MNGSIMARNNVKISGNGKKTIIFAHGFGCDQLMWRYVIPAFEENYRVVVFDYVGSGKSDIQAYDANRYGNLNGYAQDIIDICHELELKNAIFVGHSVSAMIGILASIREVDLFEKLVLIGPSPRYLNDFPDYIGGFDEEVMEELLTLMETNYAGWANYLAPAIMGNSDQPQLAHELEQSFCAMNPQIARQFARTTFLADNRQDLTEVSIPALILQCSQDIIAPLEVGTFVHYQIPHSTLRFMEATGHCPHISHPEETIQLIKEYLDTA
ncbi:alpha/beta fold hydrolase [Paenibacillus daejeonensis]|uniref:alpha/beta fold hydrolase n=1 Tax=Paenibacillus daejeonensis TaxID=135193 RepID=UPI00037988F8|nr:alpha/beta hydrolase [Paenibacillus daejeonensis]